MSFIILVLNFCPSYSEIRKVMQKLQCLLNYKICGQVECIRDTWSKDPALIKLNIRVKVGGWFKEFKWLIFISNEENKTKKNRRWKSWIYRGMHNRHVTLDNNPCSTGITYCCYGCNSSPHPSSFLQETQRKHPSQTATRENDARPETADQKHHNHNEAKTIRTRLFRTTRTATRCSGYRDNFLGSGNVQCDRSTLSDEDEEREQNATGSWNIFETLRSILPECLHRRVFLKTEAKS